MNDLGNSVQYDLSEIEEIRHKRAELIWRVNRIRARDQDAKSENVSFECLCMSYLWVSSLVLF